MNRKNKLVTLKVKFGNFILTFVEINDTQTEIAKIYLNNNYQIIFLYNKGCL